MSTTTVYQGGKPAYVYDSSTGSKTAVTSDPNITHPSNYGSASDPYTAAATSATNAPTKSPNAPAPTSNATGNITPPSSNLQPGSTGQNVEHLQNYLSQMGYLQPEQIGSGAGTYGPQTTAAVAKMQKDLGIDAGSATGHYGPQTQQAIASKYQNVFSSVQNTQAPQSQAMAMNTINQQTQPSTDPVFNAMASSMEPILGSLTQVLQNINNPALTAVSLQQEYNNLQSQYGLPDMQASLLNMQNVMRGTDQDIRDEVTKAGGTATESQVMAMTSARNNVILKQYNALATQYQAAQTNVQNMMQYATTDQQTELQRQNASASVTESLASIETQMYSMSQTMQQHTADNLNKIVTNIGYSGLANQAQGNPQVLSYYESMLGLAPGSLSNQSTLNQMETLRQQSLALTAYGKNIQAYNAGYVTGGAGGGGNSGTVVGGIDFGNVSGVGAYATDTASEVAGVSRAYNDLTNLPQGETMQDYINNNAKNAPVTANMITSAANQYGIDPNILAATLMNESAFGTLGAGAKTKNPGNVGNTDNSNTQTMSSWQEGVNQAAYQLSRRASTSNYVSNPFSTQTNNNNIDTSSLVRPPWLNNNVPLSLTAAQMEQYMNTQKSAKVDPGTNNVVAPGIGYYLHQSDGSYVLQSSLLSPTHQQYEKVRQTIQNAGTFNGSPTVTRKWTLAANAALSSFKDTGTYKVLSNVAPYISAIQAAINNPGDKSISDFELLDSFVKASKGGAGQVTDSQINIQLKGASIEDNYAVLEQKLSTGGVLSPSQRQSLVNLANGTYQENEKAYENIYVQATQDMQKQGIPIQFWGNLPDFSSLLTSIQS